MTAAIYQLQTKQAAKWICSACGAERCCNCNAPAIERLAQFEEKKERDRQAARDRMRLNREKSKENQAAVREQPADPIEDECADCETPQEFWQRSLSNMAGDAISMRAYWARQFGDWQSFEISTSLITLAEQAAGEWSALANLLRSRK